MLTFCNCRLEGFIAMCRPEKREREGVHTACYLNAKAQAFRTFNLFSFLPSSSSQVYLTTLFNRLCDSSRYSPTYTAAMKLKGPVPRFLVLLFIAFLLLSGFAHAVPMSRTVGLSALGHEQVKEENMQKLDAPSDDSTGQQGVLDNLVDDKCDDGVDVEECLKKRMMSEAHLDYIYTQEAKP